jgi:hypothetical protein
MALWLLTSVSACGHATPGDRNQPSTQRRPEISLPTKGITAKQNSAAGPQTIHLQLRPGDRFPLVKRLDHLLKQVTPQGTILTHRSSLEMWLSITVEETIDRGKQRGQMRLEAKYRRIRYVQDLAGSEIEYDSDHPPASIPLELQGYHGFKDNGISIWIGPDHQLLEIVNFDAFISRCVRDVPKGRQMQVRATLARNAGADGIANFVDDSLGLLPDSEVRLGDSWTRSRQVVQPVPMHISTRYTLTELANDDAQVAVVGTISPSTTYGPNGP